MSLLDRAPFTALGLLWPFGPRPDREPVLPVDGERRCGRLVVSNALKLNPRPEAWARAVLALRPDVLCVVELTPALLRALEAAEADRVLPDRCVAPERSSGGTGLWSRWPLEDAAVVDAGYALVTARIPGLGATVAAVHAVAPSRQVKVHEWRRAFDAVAELADRSAGPFVAAGDWNATLAHGPLRQLLQRSRLRDGHAAAGRPLARTWPARLPVALLDRVLVSGEVAVASITEHRVPGSDHLAVAADLAVAVPADRRGSGGRISTT